MRLGWRFLIPLALVNVIVVGTTIVLQQNWEWRHPMLSAIVTTAIMLGVAAFLAREGSAQSGPAEVGEGN